jgi:hypothetical protein
MSRCLKLSKPRDGFREGFGDQAEALERAVGKPCRTIYVHFPFPAVIVKLGV